MQKVRLLKIKNNTNIFKELAAALSPHKEEKEGSFLFIVEGTKSKPQVGISYPGRKLVRIKTKSKRAGTILWANLYDFEVVPFMNGREVTGQKFTYEELFKDFEKNKLGNKLFWKMVKKVYKENVILEKSPKLLGINPLLYLQVLKWLWIQEDLNYRLSWEEINSPIKYRLLNKNGKPTSRGAGRAKFYAALVLLKSGFNLEQIKKIVRFY